MSEKSRGWETSRSLWKTIRPLVPGNAASACLLHTSATISIVTAEATTTITERLITKTFALTTLLVRDARQPLPMEPGRVQRRDYEYERGGVVNLFMFCEPLQGRRWVDVTERRTKTDWAHQIKELVDERYPEAERIVLVMENLNTHTPASLYEAFSPTEARRLAEKL
jgi:hypothetical protein